MALAQDLLALLNQDFARIMRVETPASRATDPDTSRTAEKKITAGGKRGSHQRTLYEAVLAAPGLTSRQYSQRTGIEYHEVARRLPEVRTAQLIRNGHAVKCPISGNEATTWWPATHEG